MSTLGKTWKVKNRKKHARPIIVKLASSQPPEGTFLAGGMTPGWPLAGTAPPPSPTGSALKNALAYVDPSRLITAQMFVPYNPSILVTRRGLSIFDQMGLDEQVKAALSFKILAVIASGWEVTSPGGEENDWEVTTFVRDCLTHFPGGWNDALKKFLRALRYGYCLHGDTSIHTLNGDIPIRDLVGLRPWVFAWDGERVRLAKARRVWMTKRNVQCVRVSYEWHAGGKLKTAELVCTPEHPIMMRDGTYRKAGELRLGDRLMPFAQKDVGRERVDLQVKRGCGVDHWVERSHWVLSEKGIKVTKGQHAHHENGNKKDDRPENLQVKSAQEHTGEHSREWWLHASLEKRASRAAKRAKWCEENKDQLSEASSASNRKTWADPEIRARRIAGMTGKKHKSGWTQTPEARLRISVAKTAYWQAWREQRDNHKVTAVTTVGKSDVYDMEVPCFHNFSANHIVVHNSVCEKVYAERDSGPLAGKLVLDRLVELKPHHIDFETDASGKVGAIVQIPAAGQKGEGRYSPLKFVHYVYDREFENPYGKSDLEAAYRAWWTKDSAYKWFAILLERYGIPPLFALYDANQYQGPDLEQLKKVVKNIQAATMGIIPRGSKEGLEFWSQSLAAGSQDLFSSALARFDADIAKALLQPSLTGFAQESGSQGAQSGGSLARANVSWRSFMMVVREIQEDIAANAVNSQVIPQLCDLNFSGLKSYPIYKAGRLD